MPASALYAREGRPLRRADDDSDILEDGESLRVPGTCFTDAMKAAPHDRYRPQTRVVDALWAPAGHRPGHVFLPTTRASEQTPTAPTPSAASSSATHGAQIARRRAPEERGTAPVSFPSSEPMKPLHGAPTRLPPRRTTMRPVRADWVAHPRRKLLDGNYPSPMMASFSRMQRGWFRGGVFCRVRGCR